MGKCGSLGLWGDFLFEIIKNEILKKILSLLERWNGYGIIKFK